MGYAVPGDSLLRRVGVGRECGERERSEQQAGGFANHGEIVPLPLRRRHGNRSV
jgi:hypothetical protein